MAKQHAPKATLFLMELVIVLFFFSICAAICVNVFGSAQQMAVNSDALSRSAMEARSAASCYKAAGGDLEQTARLLDGKVVADYNVWVCYDKDWKKIDHPVDGGYILHLCQYNEEKAGEASIGIYYTDPDELEPPEVFTMNVKTHINEDIANEKRTNEKNIDENRVTEPREGAAYETDR